MRILNVEYANMHQTYIRIFEHYTKTVKILIVTLLLYSNIARIIRRLNLVRFRIWWKFAIMWNMSRDILTEGRDIALRCRHFTAVCRSYFTRTWLLRPYCAAISRGSIVDEIWWGFKFGENSQLRGTRPTIYSQIEAILPYVVDIWQLSVMVILQELDCYAPNCTIGA